MHIIPSEAGNTPFQQILGHNPHILAAWTQLEEQFFSNTSLSADLLEQVRRTLAFGNRCPYCMAKGKPNEIKQSPQESYATAFAEMFALDHLSISEAHIILLREVFSESQIAELCSFIAFISAAQRLGAVLDLQPAQAV
jgi:alkylhydroperoxidase family enzyme